MYCNKKTYVINFLDLLALTDDIPIKNYVDYINLTKIKDSYIQFLINEISKLRCEKDTLNREMNKEIKSLLKIIEGKENMLSRLHQLIYNIMQQL